MLAKPKLIAGAVAAATVFLAGWQVNGWRLGVKLEKERSGYADAIAELAREAAALQERNLREVARVENLRRDLADSVAENAALRERDAEVIERYIDREVIRYVQTTNARDCGLSADGVRIHDAAATGSGGGDGVPEAADATSEPDDSTIAAGNAEVVAVVARNYETCRSNARRLQALQEWAESITKD